MIWQAALLSVFLSAAPAVSAATLDARIEQLASIVVDWCVPAQKTLEISLENLPANAAQLGPNALGQLGFEADEFVIAFETSDGLVIWTPRSSCAVTMPSGGGRSYVDAVHAKLKNAGYEVETFSDKAHPSGRGIRLSTVMVPLGGGRNAVVIASYSGDDVPTQDAMIYVSVIAAEKPN